VGECQKVYLMKSQTKRGLFFEDLFKALEHKTGIDLTVHQH